MPPALDGLRRDDVRAWLTERDGAALDMLWRRADEVRRERVGDDVHLRGLVEITNYCARQCAYCGIAACAGPLPRYRMTHDEILACARQGRDFGFGTIVLQGGEDPGLSGPFVAGVVRAIKAETGAAITLSLGERERGRPARVARGRGRPLPPAVRDDRRRAVPADPPGPARHRVRPDRQLLRMRDMGYEIGTGVMVGIPGQTWDTLANDIWTFRDYDMDMIGIGPYLPTRGRRSPAARAPNWPRRRPSRCPTTS